MSYVHLEVRIFSRRFIATEISDGRADLAFSSPDEAQAVKDLLRKK
jgi:hypothetical protein